MPICMYSLEKMSILLFCSFFNQVLFVVVFLFLFSLLLFCFKGERGDCFRANREESVERKRLNRKEKD